MPNYRRLEEAEKRAAHHHAAGESILDYPAPTPDSPLWHRAAYHLERLRARYDTGEPDIPGNYHPARIRIGAQKRAKAAEPERYRALSALASAGLGEDGTGEDPEPGELLPFERDALKVLEEIEEETEDGD